jgi:hypothetical protein
VSNGDPTAHPPEPEGTGKRLVARLVEVMNARDLDALGDLFTEDFVDHDPMPGQPPGSQGMRSGLEALATQGEDVSFHLEDCFSSGDRVAYRIFGTWTVPPEFAFQAALGPPATVSLSGVGIYRCRGGRLAERWGWWAMESDGQPLTVRAVPEGES